MQPLALYQNYFLRAKTLDNPQKLGNQIVLKVLYSKWQQSSEIYILLKSLQYICSIEYLFDNRDV